MGWVALGWWDDPLASLETGREEDFCWGLFFKVWILIDPLPPDLRSEVVELLPRDGEASSYFLGNLNLWFITDLLYFFSMSLMNWMSCSSISGLWYFFLFSIRLSVVSKLASSSESYSLLVSNGLFASTYAKLDSVVWEGLSLPTDWECFCDLPLFLFLPFTKL